MNESHAHAQRTIPIRMLLVLVVIGALIATVGEARDPAHADHGSAHHATGHPAATHLNNRQLAFHDQMRKLWEDHVTWTRLAIVTFADGSAGFDATATRLLQNQTDLGNAVKPFYGDAAGNRLTSLLDDHILIAVDLLKAAKAGDSDAFAAADTRWYANANDIADFLSSANPRFWPRSEMREMMKTHLDQTLTEAASELHGDYAASVAVYADIHQHMLDMADELSAGIMKQFPSRFDTGSASAR